jgi:hypothetical protein
MEVCSDDEERTTETMTIITREIVGGAVQAQSMTKVIEGEAVFTHGNRRWHLVKGAVCQDVIEEATPSTTRKGPSGTRSQS